MRKKAKNPPADPPPVVSQSDRSTLSSELEIIPIVEETAQVTKRVVDRGSVKVSKFVTEHEEIIPVPTVHDEIEIEHVAREVWLSEPAKTRQEGDTLIIPVMEEVTVVEKRILLREEIYIRTKQVTVDREETVTLRREEVRVEDNRSGKR